MEYQIKLQETKNNLLEYICDITIDEEQIDEGIDLVQKFEDSHIDNLIIC